MTDDSQPIELRTTRTNDWTWIIVGAAIFLLTSYALAASSAADWQDMHLLHGEQVYLLLKRLVGVTGVRVLCGGLALVFGLDALGSIWRLKDGGIALQADSRGLIFHPSFHYSRLNWADVESVELTGGHPATIKVSLKHRFWSLTRPFTGRNIQLNLIAIGSTYRRAEAAVTQMRHWLGS